MTLAGDRETFAIEIGDLDAASDGRLRVVDVWIAGRSVCCDDNVAFVPFFRRCLQAELHRLQRMAVPPLPTGHTAEEAHGWCRIDTTGEAERYWFMRWGETTDNLVTHAFRANDLIVVTSQFCREHMSEHDRRSVLVARLSSAALQHVLQTAIDALAPSGD